MQLGDGKLGFLGFAALVIAIVMVWKFAVNTVAARHPNSNLAQAVVHFV